MASLGELKPTIKEALQKLEGCQDLAGDEAHEVLVSLSHLVGWCTERHELAIYMTEEGFGKLFLKLWSNLSKYLAVDKWGSNGNANLCCMMSLCINITDRGPELGMDLGKLGCITLLLECLKQFLKYKDRNIRQRSEFLHTLISQILVILHNSIHMSSYNRDTFRKSNAVDILKRCLKAKDLHIHTVALMVLVYIVNEEERLECAKSKHGLVVLLQLLKQAVGDEKHKGHTGIYAYSAKELLDAINQLAINDVNKVEIEKQKALRNIIRMLRDDFSEDEQHVAAECLWSMSFIESIRQSELLQGTIPTLEKLIKSNNKKLRGACAVALWQIKGYKPALLEPSNGDAITEQTNSRSVSTKIMLSYEWTSKERVLEIRDKLDTAGFPVWMDVTNMRGDILAAMAEAVQKSDVILMCVTEKYKESRSCRSEAAYAYKLNKKVIPLLLEPGYKPDGWLGLLQGMDLYYNFHSDDQLEANFSELLKAISENTVSCEDDVDAPVTAKNVPTEKAIQPSDHLTHSDKTHSHVVRDWTSEHVQDWLRENHLNDLCTTLDFCEGCHLRKLFQQSQDDAKEFKKDMRIDYHMDPPTYLKFIVALEKIFIDE